MKQISEKYVGGRIRKARSNGHMKIKDLASVVDVSANYISLVERGDKKPSEMLLKKIADATNVSLDWLRDGDGDSSNDSTPSDDHAVNELKYEKSILPDIRMFLALILMETPGMSKGKLAITLDVSENIIDAILEGRDTDYRPQWKSFFSGLAQRLDTPAVCSKLRTLAAYLEKEAQIAKRDQMILLSHSLQRYTETKRKQDLKPVGNFSEVKAPAPYYCMQFQGVRGGCWEFRYIRALDINIEWMCDYVNEIMGNLPQRVSLSIVFDDRTVYEAFADKAIDYAEEADTLVAEDPTGSPPSFPPDITAILVDRETYAVQEEKDCWPVEYN